MTEGVEIGDLVPHAKPMLLLDSVQETGDGYLVSELTVRNDGLFDRDQVVPAYLGLEYMAQTVAAYSGYQAHLSGKPPRLGFLLGTRRFNTTAAEFRCGEKLIVTVKQIVQGESGMAAFDCTVRGHEVEQTATLAVFEPPNSSDYLGGGS